jgi:hypothetical protein
MVKGVPFRTRLALALGAFALVALSGPAAFAQSPDDLPGFDQLPLPGGEDPSEEEEPAEEDETDDGAGTGADDANQVDAPGGGVDTGAGGLAGAPLAAPLAVAGTLAAGGATVLVRRRTRA